MPLPANLSVEKSGKKKSKGDKRVLANRYQVARRLGSGNFGTAWIVTDLKTKDDKDKLKALKEIPIGDLQEDESIEAVREASLLRNLDHPGIVKFHDSFIDGSFFCIVTEYCEGGDLDMKIADTRKKHKNIPEAQVIEWLIQLLLAMQYMHERRVLHRDLKARNIFLRNNMIKIGDFGISRILMGTKDMASTFVGTPYYMSPEVLKHEGYNSKSDVWSIGCILYEMCALKHAFEGQSLMGVMYKIVEGNLPDWPSKYSKDLKGIFEELLIKDPTKRPSANDALKLTFIAKQMAFLKTTLMDKHNQKGQKDNVQVEKNQLFNDLKKDIKIEQLRLEAEEKKWKNLTPRERMRLKKQQAADEEAKRLRIVALQQQMDNKMKYDEIKRANDPFDTHFDFDGTTKELERNKGPAFTDYTALTDSLRQRRVEEEDESSETSEQSEDEADMGTVVERKTMKTNNKLSRTADYPRGRETIGEFSRTFHADERPITPMKDKMVYNVEYSSLDFDDGIPSNPDLAETYYSQYEDFDEEKPEEGGGEGGEPEDEDDGEGTLVAGNEDELEDFIHYLENAMDQSDNTIKSQTLTENSTTSFFGPKAKETKIKNIKAEAIAKLGREQFEKAYDYLKEARFNQDQSKKNLDENSIMKGLAKMVRNPNDCFIVDQLLFLEHGSEWS